MPATYQSFEPRAVEPAAGGDTSTGRREADVFPTVVGAASEAVDQDGGSLGRQGIVGLQPRIYLDRIANKSAGNSSSIPEDENPLALPKPLQRALDGRPQDLLLRIPVPPDLVHGRVAELAQIGRAHV